MASKPQILILFRWNWVIVAGVYYSRLKEKTLADDKYSA